MKMSELSIFSDKINEVLRLAVCTADYNSDLINKYEPKLRDYLEIRSILCKELVSNIKQIRNNIDSLSVDIVYELIDESAKLSKLIRRLTEDNIDDCTIENIDDYINILEELRSFVNYQ